MNHIRIYEFSRQLRNPQKNLAGNWVSGGYEREIGLSNYDGEIPSAIKQAVDNHLFRINDNYPPLPNQVVLIAREILDSRTDIIYAVLAVASKLIDDGDRSGVYYRYFWLQNVASSQIDGIYTLLIWWKSLNEPGFKIETQGAFFPDSLYEAAAYTNKISEHNNNNQIQPYLKSIKNYPYVNCFGGDIKYIEFHHLVWILHRKYQIAQPLAWAWNVRQLEKPQNFTLINCVDNKTSEKISHSINSIALKKLSSKKSNGKDTPLSPEQQKIKKLLLDLARSPKPSQTAINNLIISRVNSPPLGAHEKSKKELQYPAACGGAVYLNFYKKSLLKTGVIGNQLLIRQR
jgi:hypothetical protein